ncbi:metallothionein Zym1 [Schizosaccharomyces pombe]|uniref:Metallothionein zym1 n=1 Tax=Schizosaccharomyces pombe (strain 972 / ATCC 24843) TaxID=284812 RepID=ZYM1_SCHPO|nr:metallothionein Zym1 [Schizosaccharomyces pombe]Q9UTC0.1 RecName: Full=Metallothionein zym1 [Schizosaccharomyces pombe 972h-]CAB57404.1 metallothionein Zym1 [Schizosaccharomyces pombe]|eukprot:NP_593743.1 metallothionein Zym1 [Schizosaccharomyces pombe]
MEHTTQCKSKQGKPCDCQSKCGCQDCKESCGCKSSAVDNCKCSSCKCASK